MCQLLSYWPCKHEIKFKRIFLFFILQKNKLILLETYVSLLMLTRTRLQQDEEDNIENSDSDQTDLDSFRSSEFEKVTDEDINGN